MRIQELKEMILVLMSGHSASQKVNYLKCRFASPELVLKHDPVTISIVATCRCNLNCDMCPTHSRVIPDSYPYKQTMTKDMDIETFKKVVDKFRNALTLNIIGAGEPLLNKDLFKMAEYATRKRKMIVKTFTNGLILKKKINEVIDSCLDGITISINGHKAGEFARMTGMPESCFHTIYEGVEELVKRLNEKKSKVRVKLAFIIDKENYKYISQMMDLAQNLGVDHTYFCNFLPSSYRGFTVDERVLTTKDTDVLDAVREAYHRLPKMMKKKITLPRVLDKNAKKKKCMTHFRQIRINGNGNVSSCSIMLLNMEGNGNFMDEDVWNNAFFRKMRKKFLDTETQLDEPCGVCVENYGLYPW